MPKIELQYTEQDIRKLILADLEDKMPGVGVKETDIHIMVKSSRNYRAEWELANFKADVSVNR